MPSQWLAYCNYEILKSLCTGNGNWPGFWRTEGMQWKEKMLVNKKHHKEVSSTRCSGEEISGVKSVFIRPVLYQASVGH